MALHVAGSTLGMESDDHACVEALGMAIIQRACADYLLALRGTQQMNGYPIGSIAELERFFRSAWFHRLSSVDGELLMLQLQHNFKIGKCFINYTPSKYDERTD